MSVRLSSVLTEALALLDGTNTVDAICLKVADCNAVQLSNFLSYLISQNLLADENWIYQLGFEDAYLELIEKQLYFLMDVLPSVDAVEAAQRKLRALKIVIVGLGSVGGSIMVQLLQMGCENLLLADFRALSEKSVSRHVFFEESGVGIPKTKYYQRVAHDINPNASVKTMDLAVRAESLPQDELREVDLIVNCADEPYIGYSNILLSRFCVQHSKILLVPGGFDAHLATLGELIIPGVTPCADCYDTHFKESLSEWKPKPHPVKNREFGFGGLVSLSNFSAAAAAMQVLKYVAGNEMKAKGVAGGRGEFRFDDYSIDSFEVQRNTSCRICQQ